MHIHGHPFNVTSGETIMSLHIAKCFNRPLALISAALLVHIGGAFAADSAGGTQQQVSDLLAGRAATGATQLSEKRDVGTLRPSADVQEPARRLLSGVADSRAPGSSAMTRPEIAEGPLSLHKGRRAAYDAQAIAQRLLLGQPYGVAARS
jgi:hypothetical protein